MSDSLLIVSIVLALAAIANLVLLVVLLLRRERAAAGIDARLAALEVESARTAEAVRADLGRAREESAVGAREAREELSRSLAQLTGRNEERLEILRWNVHVSRGNTITSRCIDDRKLEGCVISIKFDKEIED